MTYSELRKLYPAEWQIWYRMHYGCKRKTEAHYVEVSVCDEWKGQDGFIEWLMDMGPRPSPKHSLSRLNKLGDFEPDNCVWEPKRDSIQRQIPRKVGEFYDWKRVAIRNGILPATYTNRVNQYGWSCKDAATLTPEKRRLKGRLT